MAALTKQALRAEKAIRVVASTLQENREVLATGLTEFFQPYRGDEEALPAFGQVSDLMVLCLEDTARSLLLADRTKLDESAVDTGLRRERDSLAAELHGENVALKGTVTSAYGQAGLRILGFARELDPEPLVVLRQTQRVLANLGSPDKPLPPPKVAGTGIRPEEVRTSLEPKSEALADVLRLLDAEQRETVTAQLEKNSNVAHYRRTIRSLARATEALFRLIGRDDIADRIPSVVRRNIRRGRSGPTPEPTTPQASEAGAASP